MQKMIRTLVLAAGSLALTLPAQADDEIANNEIIVTATRTPSRADRLPTNVAVIDADAARARGEFTLDQALAQAPGLQAPRSGPVGQQTSIFSGGFESNHTLVLFDGVRIDDPATPEGVFDAGQDTLGDARRIEIVQGPLSALYGSGALGGVINILPRRGGAGALNPRMEFAGGTFGTLTTSVGADGTLGRFRYAINAEAYASEGYDIVPKRIATHTGEPDGAEMTTLTGVFDFALNDALALDLLLRHRDASAGYDPGFLGDIAENPAAEIKQNDSALWRLGATWSVNPALSLRLSGGALNTDRVVADAGITSDVYRGQRRFVDATATWETANGKYLLGVNREAENINAISFGAPINGAQTHTGAYLAAQGAWGPVDLTAAVRHDDFQGFGGKTTWRAGGALHVGDRARIYASLGTSYRAPSLYERFVPFFGAADLRPESARSFEIGADSRMPLFGREDGIELAALYRTSRIDDLIGFSGFSYANIDRADIDYAEARFGLHPLSWLRTQVVYANTDARDAGTGIALQRRPRQAWSVEANAQHGPLTAHISWREVGARRDTLYDDFGTFAGADRAEAYDIVRASASWTASDAVHVYVAVDNALGEVYEPVNGFAGAPRSIMLGVRLTP